MEQILQALIEQNQSLTKSLNDHSVAIKALYDRLGVIETQMIEYRKQGANLSQSPNNVTREFQSTQAYQQLNKLGVIGGI
jgi:hypothetical protein